jgi:hypothetical protein
MPKTWRRQTRRRGLVDHWRTRLLHHPFCRSPRSRRLPNQLTGFLFVRRLIRLSGDPSHCKPLAGEEPGYAGGYGCQPGKPQFKYSRKQESRSILRRLQDAFSKSDCGRPTERRRAPPSKRRDAPACRKKAQRPERHRLATSKVPYSDSKKCPNLARYLAPRASRLKEQNAGCIENLVDRTHIACVRSPNDLGALHYEREDSPGKYASSQSASV